jgi:hypothetical protein
MLTMYSLNQARTVLDDSRWLYREALRIYNHSRQGKPYYRPGIEVFDADWDNLIILDAARFDEFKSQISLEGTIRKRKSRGATSSEFIRGNFTNRVQHDTVYVSVNPHFARLQEEIGAEVHAYIPLHDNKYRDAVDGLTTRPETVTEKALATTKQYPHKRLIVHYLQPHQPYLGPKARTEIEHGHGLIDTIKRNDLTKDELRKYYRENLRLVLDEVATLVDELTGKTVITADHGELLGGSVPPFQITDYGHWAGVYVSELLDIPWFIVDNEKDRKEIHDEKPDRTTQFDMEDINSQLKDLGYKV